MVIRYGNHLLYGRYIHSQLVGYVFIVWLLNLTSVHCQDSSLPSFPLTQNYLIDNWRLDEMLPASTTVDITQTPDNYLWFGSFEGVLRFDGNRFVLFSPQNTPELPSPWVLALGKDQEGSLWLGTEVGPVRIKKGVWEDMHLMSGWKGQPIRSFAQISNGKLFIGTTLGLFEFRTNHFAEIAIPEGRGKVHLAVDNQDNLWMAREYELYILKDEDIVKVISMEDDRKVRCFLPSKMGGIWIADNVEIRLWRGSNWITRYKIPTDFRENVSSLCEDRQGCLWVAFFGHGLLCYQPDGKIGHCTTKEGLLNNALRTVIEDNEGNIWLSSNGGGVARLKKKKVQVYGQQHGLKQEIINSVVEIDSHQLLVATHSDGVVPFDEKHFGTPILTRDGNPRILNWVQSGLKDSRGNIWLGTYDNGLVQFRFETNGFRHISTLDITEVNCLFEDSRGNIWVGGAEGLKRLDGQKLTSVTNQLPVGQIISIAEDADQQLWINISGKGVYYANSTNLFKVFRSFDEKQQSRPACLYGDKSGSLWIGYRAGQLGRVQKGEEFVFSGLHGVPDVNFASLIEDDEGNLWAGSDIGIIKIIRSSIDAVQAGRTNRLDCRIHNQSDGLASRQCRRGYQPVSGRLKNGNLWFATMQGLAMVVPQQENSLKMPTPWIEEIALDGKRIPLKTGVDTNWIAPAGTRLMDITYTGISLGASERVLFQYRLQPLDSDWMKVSKERTVHFRDLHPGDYHFLLRTSYDGNEWSAPKSMTFTIEPFFWQTMTFKVSLALLIVAGSTLIGIQIVRSRYRRIMELQQRKHAEEKAAQLEISNQELRKKQQELEEALTNVKTLSGFIPICANCHNIRDDKGFWERVEIYIQNRSEAKFSHSLCPKCVEKLYPDYSKKILDDQNS